MTNVTTRPTQPNIKFFTKSSATMTPTQQKTVVDAFIASQFFLPPEVMLLATDRYDVEPILVMSGQTAKEYIDGITNEQSDYEKLTLRGDIDYNVLHLADYIGVSIRRCKVTLARSIVYKLWAPFMAANTTRKPLDNLPTKD